MASISTNGKGIRRLLFTDAGGDRRTIYLGRIAKKHAEQIQRRIEEIVASRIAGTAHSSDLAAWIRDLPAAFHRKLVKAMLVEARAADSRITVSDLLDEFLSRATVKKSTHANYKQTTDSLREFFGNDTPLVGITPKRCDEWRRFIASDTKSAKKKRTAKDNRLSPATQSKRIKMAKCVFTRAVRWGMMPSSPFDGMKAGSQVNPRRAFFVTRESIEAVLEACPDAEWRLVVGLARFAGLRCPSELIDMTWADIDWARGALTVRPPKTEHHGGHHAIRQVPISPRLRELLEESCDRAAPGEVRVVPRVQNDRINLRTTFERIIERAGLTPWPRLFQNLRSSCETEWSEVIPLASVTRWMGNSPTVALKHYIQTRDVYFEAVVAGSVWRDAKDDARATHNPTQRAAAPNRTVSPRSLEDRVAKELARGDAATGEMVRETKVGPV